MKVLITAIACCPGLGSESFVGWSAVCALAECHQTWAVVDEKNRGRIEQALASGVVSGNLHFVYHGLSQKEIDQQFLARIASSRVVQNLRDWLNYLSWNRGLLKVASKLHAEVGFDVAHHVTYATWRVGSPLICVGLPFIWGPIGGGERMPLAFLSMLSPMSIAFEIVRKFAGLGSALSPLVKQTARRASAVFVANKETESQIVKLRGEKQRVSRLLQTFFDDGSIARFSADIESKSVDGTLRIFAGGRLDGRKGIALAIRALGEIQKAEIPFEFLFGGNGAEKPHLQNLVKRLGLSKSIHFSDGFYGDAYISRLKEAHLYLMPSLRDGAPVTLMQAMLAGCVPIVLNAGGPGEIVTESCGFKIEPVSPGYVVEKIRNIIHRVHQDRKILQVLSIAASRRISETYGVRNYLEAIDAAYSAAVAVSASPAGN